MRNSPSRQIGRSYLLAWGILVEPYRYQIQAVVFTALVAWAIASWYGTIHRVVCLYNPLPVEDYWRVPQMLEKYQQFDLRVLWRQHNEHRIVFPEIIFAIDILFCRSLQILPIAANVLCYFGTLILFAVAFGRNKQIQSWVRWAGMTIAAILMGWNVSATVLASSFLLSWTLMQTAAVGALFLLPIARQRGSMRLLIGVIALAIVATYSVGSGMLIWPILIAGAVALRSNSRQITAMVIGGILAVGTYFIGYHVTGALHPATLFFHPAYALRFVCSYLSVPFGLMKGPQLGVAVGLTNLVIAGTLFVVAARKRLLGEGPAIVLFGFYALTLLGAVLTAAGRMDINDPAYTAAKAARYLTAPLQNWAAWILLCLWLADRCKRWVIAATVIGLSILTLLFSASRPRGWIRDSNAEFARQQMVTVSFQSGLMAPELIQWIFPHPAFVKLETAKLVRSHLSIYSSACTTWLGRNLSDFGSISEQHGTGQIIYEVPVLSGLQVVGWAYDGHPVPRYNWVVLANEAHRIVGFGRRLPAGFPSVMHTPQTPDSLAWVGFVNTSIPSRSISSFWVEPQSKQLIAIPGSLTVPAISISAAEDAAGPLAAKADGNLAGASEKVPQLDRFSDRPSGKVYSTWDGSDRTVGDISLTVQRPANGCIIVPVLNGPSRDGLSVSVINAGNGQVMQFVPLQRDGVRWEFWRIPVDSTVRQVRVEAVDHGQQWGQWLAIAEPVACR